MKLPTGEVPESYRIYFDQFNDDPDGTIEKLENHVTRRNSGAVGYYLLAILSKKAGKNSAAVKHALTAKILAPGSIFFSKLPYYIQHPDLFDAWTPSKRTSCLPAKTLKTDSNHPIPDLDMLITKLSGAETRRIKIPKEGTKGRDLSENSANVDDIVSETLALIHKKQGNYEAAINVYTQLSLSNSSKKEYYNEKIEELQKSVDEEGVD